MSAHHTVPLRSVDNINSPSATPLLGAVSGAVTGAMVGYFISGKCEYTVAGVLVGFVIGSFVGVVIKRNTDRTELHYD